MGKGKGGDSGSGGILDMLGLGELLGKPDTRAFDELSQELAGIARAEEFRRVAVQDPLRQQLFGTPLTSFEIPVGGSQSRREGGPGDDLKGFGGIPGLVGMGMNKGDGGDGRGGPVQTRTITPGAGSTGGMFGEFLRSGALPEALDVPWQLHQETIAQQGSQARRDLLGRVGAQGGQLRQLLGEQRISEAQQQAQIPLLQLPLRQALFESALRAALGADFPVVPGYTGAGGIRGTGEQLNLQFKENILDAAGTIAGAAGG